MLHELKPHPLALEYERIAPAEADRITADMRQNGYDETWPVVLYDKQILDGVTRYGCAAAAGVVPTYHVFEGTLEQARAFTQRANEQRRHLTPATLEKKRAERRERVAERREAGDSLRTIAKAEGVSVKTVHADVAASAVTPVTADGKVNGADGKRQPATRKSAAPKEKPPAEPEKTVEAVEADEPRRVPADVDGWGIPITVAAAEAFAAREGFEELLALLRKAKGLYKALAATPGGAFLTRPGVSINSNNAWIHAGLETCILNLKDCKPKYTVCPYAYAPNYKHDAKCNLCHGLGWTASISKTAAVPQEFLNLACDAHGVERVPF